MAALVGIGLERSIIQWLYRRPLESLLATWGVSVVLQQVFKLMFGSNNVQVSSPLYLSGNWTVNDIIFGWNRVFVIGFAVVIVFGVWLALTKTPLGLLMRAVMQNRGMASCMGVRTERVNMLTFGLGSGLAGLAGVFVTQLGNVGPSMGQNYIVDSFMTVVLGGVGSIFGTVVSALGIGLADQSLQQILLNPVLGKILVLVASILFLQWRPTGHFLGQAQPQPRLSRPPCPQSHEFTRPRKLLSCRSRHGEFMVVGVFLALLIVDFSAAQRPRSGQQLHDQPVGQISLLRAARDLGGSALGLHGPAQPGAGAVLQSRRLYARHASHAVDRPAGQLRQGGTEPGRPAGFHGFSRPHLSSAVLAAVPFLRLRDDDGVCSAGVAGARLRIPGVPLTDQGRVFFHPDAGADLRGFDPVFPQRPDDGRQQRLH